MPSTTPVDPFGCTVADVAALVPEATILASRSAGQKGVTEADVTDWITRLSSETAVALHRWSNLPEGQRTSITTTARNLVANGAASYLEAARAPERAAIANTASYAQVLWERYTSGVKALAVTVNEWLTQDPSGVSGSGAAAFPKPVIPDRARW